MILALKRGLFSATSGVISRSMKLLALGLLLSFFWGSKAWTRVDVSDEAQGARALIRSVISAAHGTSAAKSFKTFKADHCDKILPSQWIEFFLMNHPISHRYRFAKG